MRRSLLFSLVALFATSEPASAGVDGDRSPVTGTGSADSDGTVQVELAGGRPGGRGDGGRRSSGTSGTWVGYDVGVCGAGGEVWLDVAVGDTAAGDPGFEPAGVVRHYTLILPDGTFGGTVLTNSCNGDPDPLPPPSAEAILAQASLPAAQVRTTPANRGLVGFPNWFWYDGPTEVPVSASLNGWTGTATARAVAWRWDFGDGASESSPEPGTEADPAVTHTYIRQGTRQIVLTVTWEASFTLTGWGTTVSTGLGRIDLPGAPLPYDVAEREAVIVG